MRQHLTTEEAEALFERMELKVHELGSEDWDSFFYDYTVSEDFLYKYRDVINFNRLGLYQIIPTKLLVNLDLLPEFSTLLGNQIFPEKYLDSVSHKLTGECWDILSASHPISEKFMMRHSKSINWTFASYCQPMSIDFAKRYKSKKGFKYNKHLRKHHREYDPKEEAIAYASLHQMKYDDDYLYAYRNHTSSGRGSFMKNRNYLPGVYYRDWRCDLDPAAKNSFGFGIWNGGNTTVRVKLSDFGCAVDEGEFSSKARVWGFEVV